MNKRFRLVDFCFFFRLNKNTIIVTQPDVRVKSESHIKKGTIIMTKMFTKRVALKKRQSVRKVVIAENLNCIVCAVNFPKIWLI